jgi:peptidoglycan-associated lipoprotein
MRVLPLIAVLASAALLAGCPKKPTTVPEGEAGGGLTAEEQGATTGGTSGAGVGEARPLPGAGDAAAEAAAAAAAAGRIIYFDFDSSEIRPEYADLVAAQARRLATSPGQRVRLEGHTDERGSREYNIALGERRAQAVRRALLLQGVADGQVVTVSYGEERPAVEGQDEAANQKNRRVEFVDAG